MDPSGKNTDDIIYSPPNCLWTVTISDCVDQEYYQIIYDITIYLSLIVFLFAVGLFSWRIYNKPNTKLSFVNGFFALEGFLFTQIFWSSLRVLDCIILVYNLFPTNWILRQMLFTVSWLFGLMSVSTYLAGILRTIPRMHFYRQNPDYKHLLHLPNLQNVVTIYLCYIFIIGSIVTTCSFFIGYFQMNPGLYPNSKMIVYILTSVEYGVFSIGCFLLSFGFVIYGSKLIDIASEGLELLENVNDYQSYIRSKNSRNTAYSTLGLELEMKHKILKRSVRKMRIINMGFIVSILVLGIILAAHSIFCRQLLENLVSNKTFAAITNLSPMVLNVAVMLGIAYGEMKVSNKYEDDITSSTSINNNSQPSQSQSPTHSPSQSPTHSPQSSQSLPRESIETIIHTRGPSTDSETPLLSWPAPAILSPMHHYNHYDGSGSLINSSNIRNNNVSSNNNNNISSNDIRSNSVSSNNISNNIGKKGKSRRPSVSTTSPSNSPISSTPTMRVNYFYF